MNKKQEQSPKKRKGRPLVIEWSESVEQLKMMYQKEKEVNRRTRLHALWLLQMNHTLTEVSQLLDIPYRSLQRWVFYYRTGGLAEVMKRLPGGNRGQKKGFLTAEQEKAVCAKANTGAWQTAAEAKVWIEDRWGISYSEGSIYSLFKRLKINKKVPRRQAEKADNTQQEAWKKGG